MALFDLKKKRSERALIRVCALIMSNTVSEFRFESSAELRFEFLEFSVCPAVFYLIMLPTSNKLRGHIGFGSPASMRAFVTLFDACHIL